MASPSPDRRSLLERLRLRLPKLPPGIVEVVCASLVALMPISTYTHYQNDRLGFTLELSLCVAAAMVGRWPTQATIAAGLIMAALLALPMDGQRPGVLSALVIVASLGARGMGWLRTLIAVWFLVVMISIENTPPQPVTKAVTGVIGYLVLVTLAVAIGEAIRRISAERVQSQVDRTVAVQAQRRTIARDLHDTVAYATTSIILRAEQAKLRGVSDEETLADLDYIINAGRNSMRDLRGMMETLRRNEPEGADSPRSPWQIAQLTDVLAERTTELRSHGFHVTSHIDGDPLSLPESVREALGKVVVEATSNMVKHGDPGSPVSIMVEVGDQDVEAVFINRPSNAGSKVQSAQLGLVGARERVEALGGEVHVASESPDWVVRVLIPLGG